MLQLSYSIVLGHILYFDICLHHQLDNISATIKECASIKSAGVFLNQDRYSIVKKIAENVAAGSHIYDQIGWGKDVEPDITNEVKTQQTLEILIHAAALTLIEGIKSPHHKKPLTEKEIVDHYTNGILQTFHIEHHKAKKLLKKGIEYHVGINKERVLF